MQTIATQIREKRESRGLTQTQLAEKSGLSGYPIISRYESGKAIPSIKTLKKFCEVLGTTFTVRKDRKVKKNLKAEDILR